MGRQSPLHQRHVSLGAKLADFGGWDMPIEYPAQSGGGVIAEHTAVRERVGIFDVSHLGKAEIIGEGALEFLNSAITNDLNKISDGQAQYTMLCDDQTGGVIDDLIVYRKSPSNLFLIPNAANTASVVAALKSAAPKHLTVTDRHETYAVIAVQGPKSSEVLQALGIVTSLDYMSFSETNFKGSPLIVCRTGYTGEYGFELLPLWSDAEKIWDALVTEITARDGRVCGLGARDTLRTEMGYPLHGHELSLSITPIQASASWAVGMKKTSFWGKSICEKEKEVGPHRVLRALKSLDRGIPRAGMKVMNLENNEIGEVTSGTFSPTLRVGIALALVKPTIGIGEKVHIEIRGRVSEAEVVKVPLVRSRVK